jgi:hypothetical protein
MPLQKIEVKSINPFFKNSEKIKEEEINTNKSNISGLELLWGSTKTEKFAFLISILLMILSIVDLLFMYEIVDVPLRWDPAASITALVVSVLMPILLVTLAYRKMNATVKPSTVPK